MLCLIKSINLVCQHVTSLTHTGIKKEMWRLEHSLGSDNLSPRGVFQTDLVDMERHFLVALSTTLCTLSGAQTRSHDVPACEYVLQMISMKTHWYANSRATHGPVSVRHYSHGTALTRISLQYDSACLCLGAFFFFIFFMCPFVVHWEIVALSAAHFPYRWQTRSGALYHWMTRPIRRKILQPQQCLSH